MCVCVNHFPKSMEISLYTWDDVVVKGPCDSGWRDATDSTGQQQALSLVEGYVSEQLSEDGVRVNRQGHRPTVLSNCICCYTGITACILRLVQRGDEERGSMQKKIITCIFLRLHSLIVAEL